MRFSQMAQDRRVMNEDPGGLGSGGGTPNPGTPPETPPSDFTGPEWARDLNLSLEPEILSDPALGPITDINSLVKSFVHAQRNIGRKGVLIPTDNAPKEEWDAFYQKVGVPLEEQKYKESIQFGENKIFDDNFNSEFLKKAHELRVHPKQAQELYNFFGNQTKTTSESFLQQQQEQMQQELNELQQKWGPEAYGVKLAKAEQYLKETAGDDFLKYLAKSGLGKNAKIVEAFVSIAEKSVNEPNLPQNSNPTFGMTPDEIEKEINRAIADPNDPYRKPGHPDHQRRVNEIQNLFKKQDEIARAAKNS